MKKKITLKKTLIALLLLLILFQFFRIDKSNPPLDKSKDILTVTQASPEIASTLRISCYDCHSNEATYPWYTNVAPISWWIKHHINEGRQHLNFSEWGNYTAKKSDHKLEECVENVEEGEMPMTSYTLIHKNAKLNEEQQAALIRWFKSLRKEKAD